MTRLADGTVTEVILATDPNLEGEATATYLTRMLKPLGLARDPAGEWTARGRRPRVRRRGHPRPGVRREAISTMTEDADDRLEAVDARQRPRTSRPADRRPGRELPARAAGDRPRGRRRRGRSRCCCSRSARCCSPAPGWAPSRTSRRARSTSPTSAPRPTSTSCGCGSAELLDGVDTYSFVFDPYVPEVVESQLSDDLTSIATDLENGLRHYRPATSTRRCGGGSSPTSPRGATSPARRSTRCSRWSPTTGSTPTSTVEADQVAAADEMLEMPRTTRSLGRLDGAPR